MNIPDDFGLAGAGRLVRRGYEAELAAWCRLAFRDDAGVEPGGRGGIVRTPLADGAAAFVRRYRRGGWLGPLLGEAYFDRPPRPWRELVATEAARAAGIVAPEVLAAVAEPFERSVFGVPYRGLLVTRALEERRTLGEALRDAADDQSRRDWVAAAVRAVRRLHSSGVHHRDLNVSNLLVGASAEDGVAVIDFDRASVRATPVGAWGRRMAHRRLSRSIAKLALPGWDRAACRRALTAVLAGASR